MSILTDKSFFKNFGIGRIRIWNPDLRGKGVNTRNWLLKEGNIVRGLAGQSTVRYLSNN